MLRATLWFCCNLLLFELKHHFFFFDIRSFIYPKNTASAIVMQLKLCFWCSIDTETLWKWRFFFKASINVFYVSKTSIIVDSCRVHHWICEWDLVSKERKRNIVKHSCRVDRVVKCIMLFGMLEQIINFDGNIFIFEHAEKGVIVVKHPVCREIY